MASKFKKPPSQRGNRPEKIKKADPNDIRFIAMHEAGHAVASVVLGIPLEYVDIKRRAMPGGFHSVGFTRTPPVDIRDALGAGEGFALPILIQILAGGLAEMQLNDRFIEEGGFRSDEQDAQKTALVAFCKGTTDEKGNIVVSSEEQTLHEFEARLLLNRAADEAGALVRSNLEAIIATANALIERTTLTGDEVAEIVKAHPRIAAEPA